MAFVLIDDGVFQLKIRYLEALPGGSFRYYRRIPKDVADHFPGKTFRKVGLKARDEKQAAKEVAQLARQDDALWASLRLPEAVQSGMTTRQNRDAAQALLEQLGLPRGAANKEDYEDVWTDILDDHFLPKYGDAYEDARHDERSGGDVTRVMDAIDKEVVRLVMEKPGEAPVLLSDALDKYLHTHDRGTDDKFANDARRCIHAVTATVGDLPLGLYRREHAHEVCRALLATGVRTTTVRRRFATIKAVFNVGVLEFDLSGVRNPFEKFKIPRLGQDAGKREPFTTAELEVIAKACLRLDDDMRHIVAIQMDTGARMEEVAGLRLDDVLLDQLVPHVRIRPHYAHGRELKTETSERAVPLVGMALWGARRAVEVSKATADQNGWLFPRYAGDAGVKGTHASNAINKWLRRTLGISKTSHGFRHAMRDRLTGAEVDEEYKDYILGHGRKSVARGYGEGLRGYLELVRKQMVKVVRHP
jgi:integrase